MHLAPLSQLLAYGSITLVLTLLVSPPSKDPQSPCTPQVLSGSSLQELDTFAEAKGCILHLSFSADGAWLASAAADRAVAVYRYGPCISPSLYIHIISTYLYDTYISVYN